MPVVAKMQECYITIRAQVTADMSPTDYGPGTPKFEEYDNLIVADEIEIEGITVNAYELPEKLRAAIMDTIRDNADNGEGFEQ